MVAHPCDFCGAECKGEIDQVTGVSALMTCVACMRGLREKWKTTFGAEIHSVGSSFIKVEWPDVKWILDHAKRDISLRLTTLTFTDMERRLRQGK